MCAQALTVGAISARLKKPLHKINYVIKTRNIEPYLRAGNLRIFSEADVQHIESELRRIDSDLGVRRGVHGT